MAQSLTNLALIKSQEQSKSINIVYEIAGVSDYFGSSVIESIIRIGDEGLLIDGTWVIGGTRSIAEQDDDPLISVSGGTTSSIEQQLEPDKGIGSSVSVFDISLIDKNNQITALITPGNTLTDILGVRTKVYYGFSGTSFPRDYIAVFRGIISAVKSTPGLITISNSHPEEIKRQTIFKKRETNLNGAIANTNIGTFNVDSTSGFLTPKVGADGTIDDDLKFYVRIGDEIMRYEALTATSITVTERGALGTTVSTHADNAQVNTYFVIEGNAVEVALKLMLSGFEGYFEDDVNITHFLVTETEEVANSIYITGVSVKKKYGLRPGDYITITGASNSGSNNVSLKEIITIVEQDDGSYIVVDGVSFVKEVDTDAVVSFRSKWDVWPEGAGLKMHSDLVDIESHELIYERFLSSVSLRFYIEDDIEGKEFLDKEVYFPIGCYMVPKGGRSGVQFHSPPFPGEIPVNINKTNVYNFDKLSIERSINKNYYNTVIFRYNRTALDDEFLLNKVIVSADSINQIALGSKSLVVESLGLQSDLSGDSSATLVGARLLRRYEFAAENIPQVKVFLEEGVKIDVGDIILFNGEDLQISNINSGDRNFDVRLLEVVNKTFELFSGDVSLNLTDTSFDEQARYCLMSPSSKVKSGVSQTQFIIKESYAGKYGSNEYLKYQDKVGASLRIRSADGSVSGVSVLSSVSGNLLTVQTALGFIPLANYIVEFSEYDDQPEAITIRYGSMTDDALFADGSDQYSMI